RADRGRLVGPNRRPAADGSGVGAAGNRARLDRDSLVALDAVLRRGGAVLPVRNRHGAVLRAGRERRPELGATRGGRPGIGSQQLGLLRAARQRGLLVVAVDRDPAAPGFRFADRRALISFEDEPSLHRLAEAERLDGVISPANDWSVGIAARVAHRLALPHPLDPKTAALAASWLKQRERFAETGVPHDAGLGDGPEVTVDAFSLAG